MIKTYRRLINHVTIIVIIQECFSKTRILHPSSATNYMLELFRFECGEISRGLMIQFIDYQFCFGRGGGFLLDPLRGMMTRISPAESPQTRPKILNREETTKDG